MVFRSICKQGLLHGLKKREVITLTDTSEAFQGVLATGDIAQKCGDNLFRIHRQPTKTDRKIATICDGENPFLFNFQQSDMFSLCFLRQPRRYQAA